MPLTDAKIRAAKARAKPYKVFDSDGLFLRVTPTGSKLWRFRFRYVGKEKLMALGEYPRISLIDARRRRDAALNLLDEGRDPSAEKQREKAKAKGVGVLTFELVAREWHDARKNQWATKYSAQILKRLEMDLFAKIGSEPIDSLEPKDLLAALKDCPPSAPMRQICGLEDWRVSGSSYHQRGAYETEVHGFQIAA